MRDGVEAWRQRQRDEAAVAVGRARQREVGVDVTNVHRNARKQRAGRIHRRALNHTACDLRLRPGEPRASKTGQNQRTHAPSHVRPPCGELSRWQWLSADGQVSSIAADEAHQHVRACDASSYNGAIVKAVFLTAGLLLTLTAMLARAQAPAAPTRRRFRQPLPISVDFARDIVPILNTSCIRCHGRGKSRGGFSLETRAAMMEGGDSGDAVLPGKSGDSLLIHLVAGLDPDNVMPQKGSRLKPAQIGVLRAWIDQGAPWPAEINFAKIPPRNLHRTKVALPALPAGALMASHREERDATSGRSAARAVLREAQGDAWRARERSAVRAAGVSRCDWPAAVARSGDGVRRRSPRRQARAAGRRRCSPIASGTPSTGSVSGTTRSATTIAAPATSTAAAVRSPRGSTRRSPTIFRTTSSSRSS